MSAGLSSRHDHGALAPEVITAGAFAPAVTLAMSIAFEQVCRALHVPAAAGREREIIANRIVDLARIGATDPSIIVRRVLKEAGSGED